MEVKNGPQPCCGRSAAPPARRRTGPVGFGVCGLSKPLWTTVGQGLIWERSSVATTGQFGDRLLNLWVEGVPWESSCPLAMVPCGIRKSSSNAGVSHCWI